LVKQKAGNIFSDIELKRFSKEVFEKIGLSNEDASFFSDTLVQANLEGIDSHGVSKLGIYYKRIVDGRIKAKPSIGVTQTAPGIILVDGDNGPGPVVTKHAMDAAVGVVKETGTVSVGIKRSNHFGPAAAYCKLACKKNLISIICTNAPPGIAPWGARKPYFGTNPIAFGFPNGTNHPIIIDMASSVIARGKIRQAAKNGEKIKEGLAIDNDGKMTTDANEALKGSVLPFGGPKGSALALSIEILAGALSGAAFGERVQHLYNDDHENANVGHFFILIDIEKFINIETYELLINQMIDEIKALPKSMDAEEILIPGERRISEVKKRKEKGIYISASVLKELKEISDSLKVSFLQSKQTDG
jgi:LDH2 family malate/lactate/ureidoglycolate dehydrogenase